MNHYYVTKEQIIKALETEPLGRSGYFLGDGLWFDKDPDGKCPVCAVGAILRQAAKNRGELFETCDIQEGLLGGIACWHEIYEAYESGNLLSILSTEFENMAIRTGDIDLARFHAISIVEGMFPQEFTFTV